MSAAATHDAKYASRYYDRDGTPISDTVAWAKKLEDAEYQRVAYDELPHGLRVSTVWLGLDHSHGSPGPPLIFETMVFPKDSYRDLACTRYATEREAREGHARIVEAWMPDGDAYIRSGLAALGGDDPCPV